MAVILAIGALVLVLLLAVLTANRLNGADLIGEENCDEINVIQENLRTLEKNRAVTAKIITDELISVSAQLRGLMQDDMDAATVRTKLAQTVDMMNDYLTEITDLTAATFVCAHRGHKFECIDVTLSGDEPAYMFVCPECTVKYSVLDSQLNKKEAVLVKKYVESFLPKCMKK